MNTEENNLCCFCNRPAFKTDGAGTSICWGKAYANDCETPHIFEERKIKPTIFKTGQQSRRERRKNKKKF